MSYFPTVGLEIHAELKTKSKMFCSCVNDPDEKQANINICPICTAHPGVLPVINREAVRKTIKTGLALNCQIPQYSKFDRKNYFYPDLPKGYQISQLYMPFCENGFLEINNRNIRIREIHLEEDTGRLVHPEGVDYSLVDFNRAGVPLMELVTEPDIHSAKEARKFAEEFQLILRYLDVSYANMEKGQLRIEVNISLQCKSKIQMTKSKSNPKPKTQNPKLGTKVEIKNLNSFKAVEKGIEYEIERQSEILEKGEKVIQETRGWHDAKQITISQREKEEAHDYRYFPEPDLTMIKIDINKNISLRSRTLISSLYSENKIKSEISELPQAKRERFKAEYDLSYNEIEVFVQNKNFGEYFEKVMSELRNWIKETDIKRKVEREEFLKLAKICANYTITDLQGLLKGMDIKSKDFSITAENFAEFITLLYKKEISSKIAKIVLSEMFKTGADPSHIIKNKGLSQVTDELEIEKVIKDIISKNPQPVEDYKKGKENALQFLIGQVMAATRGKAKPETVNKILRKNLTPHL